MARKVFTVVFILVFSHYSLWATMTSTGFARRLALPQVGLRSDKLPALPPSPAGALDATSLFVGLVDVAFETADQYDVGRFFLEDLGEALDHDPLTAFAFVRDEIGFDPYRGILRGAEGTLGAQAGNAYDRSLLLLELLEDMAIDARLVFGTLSDDLSAKLVQRALIPSKTELDLEPLYRLAGLSVEVQSRFVSRAKNDYSWLMGAVGDRLQEAMPEGSEAEDVQDHVWVQAYLEGQWTDLDTSFPEAEPGRAFTKPERFKREALHEDRHRVELKVVAESLENNRLTETTLIELTLDAATAPTSQIFLSFVPEGTGIGGALADVISPQTRFVPVITVDGESKRGTPIPGITKELSEAKEFFFGDQSAAELTALHLQIEIATPGGTRNAKRRNLLDRIPSSLRRTGQIKREELTRPVLVNEVPSPYLAVHQILISNGGLNPHQVANDVGLAAVYAGTRMNTAEAVDQMSLSALLWPVGTFRTAWVAVDERLPVDALNDRTDIRFFIPEPRVYIMSAQPDDSPFGVSFEIDLLHDVVRDVARTNTDSAERVKRYVWYGILQSAMETTNTELRVVAFGRESGAVISASMESEGSPILLSAKDSPHVPDGTPIALIEDLNQGNLVIASENALARGLTWWSVSPKNGSTRAMLAPNQGGSRYGSGGPAYRGGGTGSTSYYRNYINEAKASKAYNVNPADFEKYKKGTQAYDDHMKARAARKNATKSPKDPCKKGGTEYSILQCIGGAVRGALAGLTVGGWLLWGFFWAMVALQWWTNSEPVQDARLIDDLNQGNEAAKLLYRITADGLTPSVLALNHGDSTSMELQTGLRGAPLQLRDRQ